MICITEIEIDGIIFRETEYDEYYISECGKVYSDKTGRILKNTLHKTGYLMCNLYIGKYKCRFVRVHILVAKAYMPNPDNKRTVNHIDGDKTNNNVNNLEWNTHAENMKHAYAAGIKKPYKRTEHTKLLQSTANIGINAKKVIDTDTGKVFDTLKAAAKNAKINRATLSLMLNGRKENTTTLKYL